MKFLINTKKLTETAIITAIIVALMLMGVYILPIIFIIYPVPFIILGVRNGIRYSLLSIITTTFIVGILINVVEGLYILAISSIIALPIIYMLKKKTKTTRLIIFSSIISLISTSVIILLFSWLTGIDIMGYVRTYFNEILNGVKTVIDVQEISDIEKNQIIDLVKFVIDQMMLLIPSSIIIVSIFYSMINYWLSIMVLRRLGYKLKNIPRFTHFRLPANISTGIVVMALGILVLKILNFGYYENIAINIVSVFYFLFYVQGLAVIVFLLNKTKLSNFVRRLLIFFIFITISLSFVIAIIGLLDSLFNFRKLNKYEI